MAVPLAGRRDAPPQGAGRAEERVREPQRREDLARREAIERLTRGPSHDLPQQDRVHIGVEDARPGAVDRGLGEHAPQRRRGIRFAIERQGGPQPRRVREQVAYREPLGARGLELREVGPHRGVEPHRATLDEHHQGGGRCHDLGERREIEQRAVGVHRGAPRRPGESSVALEEEDGVRPAHDQDGARVRARANSGLDDRIEGRGVEARVCRRGRPGARL